MSLHELKKVNSSQRDYPSYREIGSAREIFYCTPEGLLPADAAAVDKVPEGWKKVAVPVIIAAQFTEPQTIYELAIFRRERDVPGLSKLSPAHAGRYALEGVETDLTPEQLAEVYTVYHDSLAPHYPNQLPEYITAMAQGAFRNVGLTPPQLSDGPL